MAKPSYSVVPQKSDGTAYLDVAPHQATSWAVRKTERRHSGGKIFTISAILSRHATKTQAEGECQSHERSKLGPIRNYILGKRMVR